METTAGSQALPDHSKVTCKLIGPVECLDLYLFGATNKYYTAGSLCQLSSGVSVYL